MTFFANLAKFMGVTLALEAFWWLLRRWFGLPELNPRDRRRVGAVVLAGLILYRGFDSGWSSLVTSLWDLLVPLAVVLGVWLAFRGLPAGADSSRFQEFDHQGRP